MNIKNLYDFLDILKSSFKRQYYTLLSICVLGIVFNFSLVTGNKILAILSGYPLAVLSTIGTTMVAPGLVNNMWFSISHYWKAKPFPVLPEITALANDIGVKDFNFKIRDDIDNAYTKGRDIVVGLSFLVNLRKESSLFVIAHELQHMKGKHLVKISCILYLSTIILALNYFALPKTVGYLCMLSALLVLRTPISHYFEYEADKIGKQFVGVDNAILALKEIVPAEKRNEPSLTHPSINDRIKRLSDLI